MRPTLHTFRAAVAAGLSLWIAVLACLVGCTVPILAGSASLHAPSVRQNSAAQIQPVLMPDMRDVPDMLAMPDCPHHSGGHAPAKPNAPKPSRGGAMSCCPVEVTVASKPCAFALHLAPANRATARFVLRTGSAGSKGSAIRPESLHSGRDTLLATRLLRI
jgi:hypothetical protein